MGSISYTDINEGSNVLRFKDIDNHGQRLLPHVVDHTAEVNPGLVIGLIAKPSVSDSVPYEFTKLTISQFADAVNHTAHWLDSILGKDAKQVIGFVGLQVSRNFLKANIQSLLGHSPLTNLKIQYTNPLLRDTGFQILNHRNSCHQDWQHPPPSQSSKRNFKHNPSFGSDQMFRTLLLRGWISYRSTCQSSPAPDRR